ncbi:hypothetical protein Ddye_017659 [Dipteronia dyeriana]|uniref:Inhibitor I9 domain-containing protein n=1 Tax=Dipteronia dyeriana TaxID=168575 RepID=A0AAD9UA34_9ROSI|nr:hypothetical protein Ddye_017659 [Dipteronia dyeriana]
MMLGKDLLFLVQVVTTTYIGVAMTKSTYKIHMDKIKMAANLFRLGESMQTYQAVIDSINEMSLQRDDREQQAELVYAYETAISGFAAKLSTKQLQSLEKVDGFLSATPGKMLLFGCIGLGNTHNQTHKRKKNKRHEILRGSALTYVHGAPALNFHYEIGVYNSETVSLS